LQAGATPLPRCVGPATGQPDVETFDTWTPRRAAPHCAAPRRAALRRTALRSSLIRLKKGPMARVLARELHGGV